MFDLAVIGAGWAGFSAAQEVKRLGRKVALIEKDKIGGTCLNYGCIPTKALIQSAKIYSLSQKSAKFGIEITGAKIIFTQIQKRKDAIIQQLGKGMQFLLKDIDLLNGQAQFISREELIVGDKRIQAKKLGMTSFNPTTKVNTINIKIPPAIKYNAIDLIPSLSKKSTIVKR